LRCCFGSVFQLLLLRSRKRSNHSTAPYGCVQFRMEASLKSTKSHENESVVEVVTTSRKADDDAVNRTDAVSPTDDAVVSTDPTAAATDPTVIASDPTADAVDPTDDSVASTDPTDPTAVATDPTATATHPIVDPTMVDATDPTAVATDPTATATVPTVDPASVATGSVDPTDDAVASADPTTTLATNPTAVATYPATDPTVAATDDSDAVPGDAANPTDDVDPTAAATGPVADATNSTVDDAAAVDVADAVDCTVHATDDAPAVDVAPAVTTGTMAVVATNAPPAATKAEAASVSSDTPQTEHTTHTANDKDDNSGLKLTENDVICTRNSSAHNHPGNQQYHKVIVEKAVVYKTLPKRADRIRVVMEIIDHVESKFNARFLRYNAKKSQWLELNTSEKREKIAHALRIAPAPNSVRKRQSALAMSLKRQNSTDDQVDDPTGFGPLTNEELADQITKRVALQAESALREGKRTDCSPRPKKKKPKRFHSTTLGTEGGENEGFSATSDAESSGWIDVGTNMAAAPYQQSETEVHQQILLLRHQIQEVHIQQQHVQRRLLVHQQAAQRAVQVQQSLLRHNVVTVLPGDHAFLIQHEQQQLMLLQQRELQLRKALFQLDQRMAIHVQNARAEESSERSAWRSMKAMRGERKQKRAYRKERKRRRKHRNVDNRNIRPQKDDGAVSESSDGKPKSVLEEGADDSLMILSGSDRDGKTTALSREDDSLNTNTVEIDQESTTHGLPGARSQLNQQPGTATILTHPLAKEFCLVVDHFGLVLTLPNRLRAMVSNLKPTTGGSKLKESKGAATQDSAAIVCLCAAGITGLVNVECCSAELLKFLSDHKICIPVISDKHGR